VANRPRVFGEFDENGHDLLPNLGELTPAIIALVIAARINRFFKSEAMQAPLEFLEAKERSLAQPREIAERVPHFCSGCPHNISTKVPEGSRAMGGIGCHYMATWMPDRDTFTFSQMGGEGVAWIGQAPLLTLVSYFYGGGWPAEIVWPVGVEAGARNDPPNENLMPNQSLYFKHDDMEHGIGDFVFFWPYQSDAIFQFEDMLVVRDGEIVDTWHPIARRY
jgi:hypothetical protein